MLNTFKSALPLNIDKIVVFLTPGFEEGTAVRCLEQLREAGLPVSLVSTYKMPVNGRHGIKIEPDETLDDILDTPIHMLVIAGGGQTIHSLLLDNRFNNLLQKTLQSNGYIVPIGRTKKFLLDFGSLDGIRATQLIDCNNGMTDHEFINEVVKTASLNWLEPAYQH